MPQAILKSRRQGFLPIPREDGPPPPPPTRVPRLLAGRSAALGVHPGMLRGSIKLVRTWVREDASAPSYPRVPRGLQARGTHGSWIAAATARPKSCFMGPARLAGPLVPTLYAWLDFEPPAWGEFGGAGPTVTGTGTALTQDAAAAFPDRVAPGTDGLGLKATLTDSGGGGGTGSSYLTIPLYAARDVLHLRMMVAGPPPSVDGTVTIAKGIAAGGGECWRWGWDTAARSMTFRLNTTGGDSMSVTLSAALPWYCLELRVSAEEGTAEMWVNGRSVATLTAAGVGVVDFAPLAASFIRFGAMDKSSGLVGTFAIDEVRVANHYIGPVAVVPTVENASDPARWLVIYNTASASSIEWAESYRAARGVPYANLIGLNLGSSESIDAAAMAALADAVTAYIDDNGLSSQVCGVLLGYRCPGVATIDGTDYSVASLLAHPDDADGQEVDNGFYVDGVVDVADLPDRVSLMGGPPSAFLVAEINAPTLELAEALPGAADALTATDLAGRVYAALHASADKRAASGYAAGGWDAMAAWWASLDAQRVRLPIASSYTGAVHGHAIEFPHTTDSVLFTVAGQRKALLCNGISDDAATVLWTSGGGGSQAARAVTAGYAFAVGHVSAPADASAQLNPAALLAAFRAGWTFAEALAVAAPTLRSTWRAIGDPLGTMPLPLAGYDVHKLASASEAESAVNLTAILPATAVSGALALTLDGHAAGERFWVSVRARNRFGLVDAEPAAAAGRRVRVTFDDAAAVAARVPNRPIALKLVPGSGGVIVASWGYVASGQAVAPATFRVYTSIDGAAWDFGTPALSVAVRQVNRQEVTLGPFTHGAEVRVIVRARASEANGSGEETNVLFETARADAAAPGAIDDDRTTLEVE